MRADRLSAVARDLTLLAGGDRRAILAALGRDDRDRVIAAMRGGRAPATSEPRATPHSAWLEQLIATARRGDGSSLTAAARNALLDAADRDGAPAVATRASGRSLLQAAGGLFASARAR